MGEGEEGFPELSMTAGLPGVPSRMMGSSGLTGVTSNCLEVLLTGWGRIGVSDLSSFSEFFSGFDKNGGISCFQRRQTSRERGLGFPVG